MPRLAYIEPDQLDATDRDVVAGNYSAFKALAHSPRTCRQFRAMVYHLKRTKLDPRLRELALLQIGWLSQCHYEWFHHVKTGMECGVSEEDIRIIMDGSAQALTRLDGPARLVLHASREMYVGPAAAYTVESLKELLGSECLVDLIVAIGYYIGGVRILSTLDLDLEPEYEAFTTLFPLRPANATRTDIP